MSPREYRKLLNHPEWKRVRADILDRDNYQCRYCGYRGKYLEVHHKRYYNGMPWETPYSILITLCSYCHQDIHS